MAIELHPASLLVHSIADGFDSAAEKVYEKGAKIALMTARCISRQLPNLGSMRLSSTLSK